MSGEATSRGQFRKRSSGCRRTRIGTHPISHGLRAAGPVLLKTSRPHCERDVGGRHQDRHSALRSRPSWRHLETAAVLGAWTVAGPSSARSVPIACSRRRHGQPMARRESGSGVAERREGRQPVACGEQRPQRPRQDAGHRRPAGPPAGRPTHRANRPPFGMARWLLVDRPPSRNRNGRWCGSHAHVWISPVPVPDPS